MSLPDEIKLHILHYVDVDLYNTLQMLRRTHPWFKDNISRAKLPERLLQIERAPGQTTIPYSRLVCYTCVMVLPEKLFADNARRGPKGLGRSKASNRFCIDCGVKCCKYLFGSRVMIDGKLGIISWCCRELCQGDNIYEDSAAGIMKAICTKHGADGGMYLH